MLGTGGSVWQPRALSGPPSRQCAGGRSRWCSVLLGSCAQPPVWAPMGGPGHLCPSEAGSTPPPRWSACGVVSCRGSLSCCSWQCSRGGTGEGTPFPCSGPMQLSPGFLVDLGSMWLVPAGGGGHCCPCTCHHTRCLAASPSLEHPSQPCSSARCRQTLRLFRGVQWLCTGAHGSCQGTWRGGGSNSPCFS